MADKTPTTLTCPSCGAPLDYDGTNSVVRCKFCENTVIVPGLPAAQNTTSRAALDEVRQLVQDGNMVDAIYRYREIYDVSLKEAKDAVDALADGKVVTVHRAFSGSLSAEETNRVLDEVTQLLQSGNKISAIKHYREVNDVSLTQAKAVVDQIESALTGIPLAPRPEITGQPASTAKPAKTGLLSSLAVTFTILSVAIGSLAYALFSDQANVNLQISSQVNLDSFSPHLLVYSPAILLPAGAGTPADVAALFYDSGANTRLIGLLDGNSGNLRWQAAPLSGGGYADALTTGGNLIYAANENSLLAYRKSDGSLAWQTQMPDKLSYGDATLLVTAGRVITLNTDRSLQAYDAASGSLAWNRRLAGYDRTLRLMGGSLVLIDSPGDTGAYNLIFLDPLDGHEQRVFTPTCQHGQYPSISLYPSAGVLYDQTANALFLAYDSSYGCVQRIDFVTSAIGWSAFTENYFSFSSDGFHPLATETTLYFGSGNQLLAVDKRAGTVKPLLTNADYDFFPLAATGDTLIVRARRARGTERFAIWGLNAASGDQRWQMDMQGATPIDPPNKMSGLIDETDFGFTWKLVPAGLMLIKFQGNPNQMTLDTINPADGALVNEQTISLSQVTGDFYSIPTVIGWQDTVVYFSLDAKLYALDITTGKFRLTY
ncbi:MAG: hypothetical protein CO094_14090 [Anaerolineae bacterium CG_4_9_14_3_um_filter_57_17]|nr:PQQ-binding-like beta-propeller repeat protein [bacterium]NCT19977.1 PQQ-binding-like beta-propeller repeat protein [bacterium]OIO84939.1 MAG: hypothetical protein AUK01_07675 [Anaerolineae bacterium CG2_30_57_67]PJB64073.1 MAG: hypothetical protein CO094_14090 [Anaerolineae bacterium CG_4_9_14_3_um_filter_57_17]